MTNTKVESDLKREKGERIQGAGREYYLEEDLREARKEIEALTEEVRSLSKERVAGASRTVPALHPPSAPSEPDDGRAGG